MRLGDDGEGSDFGQRLVVPEPGHADPGSRGIVPPARAPSDPAPRPAAAGRGCRRSHSTTAVGSAARRGAGPVGPIALAERAPRGRVAGMADPGRRTTQRGSDCARERTRMKTEAQVTTGRSRTIHPRRHHADQRLSRHCGRMEPPSIPSMRGATRPPGRRACRRPTGAATPSPCRPLWARPGAARAARPRHAGRPDLPQHRAHQVDPAIRMGDGRRLRPEIIAAIERGLEGSTSASI